jgi:hypothetical protein
MNSITNSDKRFTDVRGIKFGSRTIPPVKLLPNALSELFAQAISSGCLTVGNHYKLRAALLDDSLSDDERAAIDRLLYAVRKGRICLVDEISSEIKHQILEVDTSQLSNLPNERSKSDFDSGQSVFLARRIPEAFSRSRYTYLSNKLQAGIESVRETA